MQILKPAGAAILTACLGVVGCSAEAPTTAAASDALGSDAMYGVHRTCWVESEGDEGPIPYRAIDIKADGTFKADLYRDNIGPHEEHDWLAAHPDAVAKGSWKLTHETISSAHHPIELDFITFTESAESAWTYDLNSKPEAHSFKVTFKMDADGAYALGWENAYYENPLYVREGANCSY